MDPIEPPSGPFSPQNAYLCPLAFWNLTNFTKWLIFVAGGFEWRTHRVVRTCLHSPTPLVPRPRFGLRANPSSGYWEGGTLVWTLPKRTSPQPTRDDVQFKIKSIQWVWKVSLWPVDTIEWYHVVASIKSIKFNPLTFFPLGPRFRDICRWDLDWQCHLAIFPHTFRYFTKWPKTGVKFLKLLRCKLTGGPKWRCFRKHLASLHENIEN